MLTLKELKELLAQNSELMAEALQDLSLIHI